jgi:hypothetical protein
MVATVARAVWGRPLPCCNKTPVPRSPHHLDLIPEKICTRGTVDSVPKMKPRSSQKRVSITFPADGCARNFFGFGWVEMRHSLLALLVSGWC